MTYMTIPATARRVRDRDLIRRGRLFKNFVGRDPYIEPLLKRRGLDGAPGSGYHKGRITTAGSLPVIPSGVEESLDVVWETAAWQSAERARALRVLLRQRGIA